MLTWILLGLSAFCLCAALIPLWRHPAWWVRGFDYPRAQFFFLETLLLPLLWIIDLPSWVVYLGSGMLLPAVILDGYRVLPYSPLWPYMSQPETDPQAPSLSIVVANVLMSNRDTDTFLGYVRRWAPDIVVTLEPNDWWAEQLKPLHDIYPHRILHPLSNRYGILLYSRLPLSEKRVQYLINPEIPSIDTVVTLTDERRIRLICLHPEPPSPTEADESTERDGELMMVGRHVSKHDQPTIVLGDLNDVAWSHSTRLFLRLSKLLDPRRGRGIFSTFPAAQPWLRWPLDHVFHSRHFRLISLDRLPRWGSDHLSIYVSLSYTGNDDPDAGRGIEQPVDDDISEAHQTIAAAKPMDRLRPPPI
ncbi:MAG: endonuclease/exonuclease/phosphatase family protein [Wenzhouxiangellaceae bacterium]